MPHTTPTNTNHTTRLYGWVTAIQSLPDARNRSLCRLSRVGRMTWPNHLQKYSLICRNKIGYKSLGCWRVNGWLGELVYEWVVGLMDVWVSWWVCGWVCGALYSDFRCVSGWMGGWVSGWWGKLVYEWVVELLDGWVSGWVGICMSCEWVDGWVGCMHDLWMS